jgi:hypothetical protein
MKKIFFGIIICLSILISTSCKKSSNTNGVVGGNVSSQLSWSCDIDGVNYAWSGTYPTGTSDGLSTFSVITGTDPYAQLNLALPSISGKRKVIFTINFPQVATGTYNFNPTNNAGDRFAFLQFETSTSNLYTNTTKGSFTVNINTLAPNTTSEGLVTGTFSGTLYNDIPLYKTITIKNGQFKATRKN